jgi:pimeloyl-ACP methyl ester carboxylesterase
MLYSITSAVTSFYVDGAELDVATDGNGDAIVLIHGFPLTREIWNAQASQLAKSHRVIRPDLRGMGRSSAPDGPYLMETLAGDLAAILDAMAIDRAAIVGHSLGGFVALAFARMYTERVARLALVCSRLGADSPEIAGFRNDLADLLERENSIEPAVESYIPKLFSDESLQKNFDTVERARGIARTNSPRGAAAMLRGIAQRVESYDIAADLAMPVLIVAGAGDKVVSQDEAQTMRAAFPAARLTLMKKSGHLPMLEEPEALTAELAAFVSPGSG